jgi:hypothetical protein
MATPVESSIGFSDSELDSYTREADELIVRVNSWNGKLLVVVFRDVIGQRDLLAGDFSDLVAGEIASQQFLQDPLRRNYGDLPATHPYVLYPFLNHDSQPALEVVASGCVVSVEAIESEG